MKWAQYCIYPMNVCIIFYVHHILYFYSYLIQPFSCRRIEANDLQKEEDKYCSIIACLVMESSSCTTP